MHVTLLRGGMVLGAALAAAVAHAQEDKRALPPVQEQTTPPISKRPRPTLPA